tara:strand:+ start:873 stop:1685 length:813 start_codon:yes stop_codon:yes gene_type:complete
MFVNLISIVFIFLVFTIYRYIRAGKSSLIYHSGELAEGQNYIRAESVRFKMIFIGFITLIYHSIMLFGLYNAVVFFIICMLISLVNEIIGMKFGIPFGGIFKYNKKKNGPILLDIPIFILITWFGLIYMSLVFSIYFFNYQNNLIVQYNLFILLKLSFFPGILMLCIDIILDPIAVNEKRWAWNKPGSFYGIPILNFFGWFLNTALILSTFIIVTIKFGKLSFENVNSIPAILFSIVPIIASRPCFERKLYIPGFFGIFYSVLLINLFFW